MNIQTDKPYTIYLKQYENRKYYKVRLSKKKQDGSFENGYIDIQFKKGVDINNKDQIYLKDAFLTFYKSKEDKTIPYIMVLEYDLVKDVIEKEKKDIQVEKKETDPFEEFAKEVEEDELDLPF